MIDSFAEHVREIAQNVALPEPLRALAVQVVTNWQQGISPSKQQLQKLSAITALTTVVPCTRMADDGACEFLRRHGKGHGLPVPPIGERALCVFPNAWNKCPGYRRN